ncbi:hypothetical protein B0T19DRAFT_475799 [Cercophora scortea]|uniref:Uncharacterized protein n=1 Tax=Cercophora scortea TaxID=314031 RepID=A0AAE0INA2_9PEZI|nr:hypothetical protein B0T19DRAFT_475799 [Cercophora scortea]
MDDPWGSPWTTDHDKHHKPSSPTKSTRSARSAKSELEPPPRAFFSNSSSSSPRIPAITAESPWADVDDHGLGDWAAPELLGSTPTGWGGAWGGTSSPNLLTSPPRHDAFGKTNDTFGKAGPIAWPGSIAIPQATSGSAFRQPSPDPWATDFSARTPSRDDISTPRLVVDSPRPLDVLDDVKQKLDVEPEQVWDTNDDTGSEHKTAPHEKVVPVGLQAEPSATSSASEEKEQERVDGCDYVRPSVESVSTSHISRPSSPSGDDTDDENDRQDSPITSIDEESKVRQQVVRQTSGKVQQLVTKFDGLARSSSQEPRPIPSRGRSESRSVVDMDDGADEAGDFGDFEDADEVVELPEKSTPERTVTPRPVGGSPRTWNSPEASSPQSARDASLKSGRAISNFGQVKFEVDLSNVDALFGKDSLDSTPSVATVDSDLSDHIVTDSFTEISERKTWYRISRLGSSMKHNAGDDDNYRRVAWATSNVRLDTIKTVRRWMEEDSITGRVTLGGGVSKTQKNMFGWDSSLEPVALDAVHRWRRWFYLHLYRKQQPGSPPLPQDNDDADDDDWGEMVSSPTEAKPPANGFHIIDDASPPPTSGTGFAVPTIPMVPGTSVTKLETSATVIPPTTAPAIDPCPGCLEDDSPIDLSFHITTSSNPGKDI